VSLYGELVLADDVEIFPIADLAPETRDAVPHDPGDFALSRARSRDASRVLGRESRDLLLQFKEPSRIVDAVIRYAVQRGVDPEATLEGAFEMLSRFYRSSVLVPIGSQGASGSESSLSPGSALFGFTLGHSVHELEDTKVFFARDPTGRPGAVKIVGQGTTGVEREADAMRRAGKRAPEVWGVHEWEGRGVLISEWISGEEVTSAATMLRGRQDERTDAGLLTLVAEVAEAIAEIHRGGVLHGDIHPGNVLIEKSGRARVIDFGLAVGEEAGPPYPGRGGVAFYMDPELALASLKGERVPPLTAKGEQYSLGSLAYLLWTGVHYLDWSLERSAMLKQIAEGEMRPFARRHIAAWPELEALFGRALAKSPTARLASCTDFAIALRALIPEARRRDESRSQAALSCEPKRSLGRKPSSGFFERCGLGGPALRDKPLNPPYGSVNYGAAGIAYAMYKIAVARDDANLLATADVWAQKAVILAGQSEAFHTSEIEINERTVGNASLFHSPSGVHAVRALVALARGELAAVMPSLSEFVAASRVPCVFDDLTLGKAGLLVGCAELLEGATGALGCDPTPILERGGELRDQIQCTVNENSFATCVSLSVLGFAHGWAGLLFALLRWSQATGESAEPYRAKLDELAALHEPHGTGMRWPTSNRTVTRPAYMDGWCSGSAGHTLLWALAHDLLGGAEYGTFAERSALSAWSSEITVGTLCCGLAGIGYACAAAQRVTGDAAWLRRSRSAAQRALEDRSKWFYRDSLYKGGVGAVLLCEELEASQVATPLVERCPWPRPSMG
jgi:serine/threonine protein kinase